MLTLILIVICALLNLIHLVVSGKGTYYIDKERYDISAGSAFIIRPETLVSWEADLEDPWEYYWVGFNGADASRLVDLTAFEQDRPVITFTEQEAEQIKKSLLKLYSNFGTSAAQELMTVSKLFETFSLITRAAPKKHTDSSSARLYIKSAITYIQRNFASSIK